MALGLFLQASLVSAFLLTGSTGQPKKVNVYRFSHDTRNIEDESDSDWTDPQGGGGVRQSLLFDDSAPTPDASENGPRGNPNVYTQPLVTPNPSNAESLVNNDRKLPDSEKPLTFPLNPHLKPQVATGDHVFFRPFQQPPSQPSTNRLVSQGSFYLPSKAWHSWSPVVSNRFYSPGPQTNYFRGRDSTSPYFYNRDPFPYPLDNSYGGTLNRHGDYKHEESPTGNSVDVPEGPGQSFSKRNYYYAPVNYRPFSDQMYGSSVVSNQPSPQRGRRGNIPRYIIQSRSGYQTIRQLASKTSYDPKV